MSRHMCEVRHTNYVFLINERVFMAKHVTELSLNLNDESLCRWRQGKGKEEEEVITLYLIVHKNSIYIYSVDNHTSRGITESRMTEGEVTPCLHKGQTG